MNPRGPRRPPPGHKPSAFAPALLVAALIALVGIFHVAGRVAVIQRGYALSRLAHQNRELIRDRELLRLEVASLRLPSRVESYARRTLGMAPPAPDKIVVLGARRAARVPDRALAEALRPGSGQALRPGRR